MAGGEDSTGWHGRLRGEPEDALHEDRIPPSGYAEHEPELEDDEMREGVDLEGRMRRAQASFNRAWLKVRRALGEAKAWSDADTGNSNDEGARGIEWRVAGRERLNQELEAVAGQLEASVRQLHKVFE